MSSNNDLMRTKVVEISFPDGGDDDCEDHLDHIFELIWVNKVTINQFIEKLLEVKSYVLQHDINIVDVLISIDSCGDINFQGLRYETPQEQLARSKRKKSTLQRKKKAFEKMQKEIAKMEAELG